MASVRNENMRLGIGTNEMKLESLSEWASPNLKIKANEGIYNWESD